MEKEYDMKKRTKRLAFECWKFCSNIPKSREFNAWVNQLIRCSSSVGANYRASQLGKSTRDFIYKLKIVEEEADETMYWLELFELALPEKKDEIGVLKQEAKEVLSIIIASIKTARKNQSK